jgi:bifunctional non-homologous end joining protein LigD
VTSEKEAAKVHGDSTETSDDRDASRPLHTRGSTKASQGRARAKAAKNPRPKRSAEAATSSPSAVAAAAAVGEDAESFDPSELNGPGEPASVATRATKAETLAAARLGETLERYRDKRDGTVTPEPMASVVASSAGARSNRLFVVHEHDATRLHYDLRLEIDGVLVSWAIPHGPSMNPDDKRLAVKVEAHPLEYINFEAVIPPGNYGAGPMICWDRGQFRPLLDPAQGMLDGEIKFELWGYKLRGAFTLVHTGKHRRGQNSGRGSNDWLLIKKRDTPAEIFRAAGQPISMVSVLSGLTVGELENAAPRAKAVVAELATFDLPRRAIELASIEPMLCHTADKPFSSPDWVFELKYDGYRLLAEAGVGRSQLRYRSGLDPTDRYPEITAALRALPIPGLVLDGEVVAFDAEGRPDFARLAGRAQLTRASEIHRASGTSPVTYVVFDLIAAAGYDLRGLPLLVRKALLARFCPTLGPLRYGDHIPAQGEAFLAQVIKLGLEGVVAKRVSSPYRATRSRDWQKLKADPEADFAVCGYTAPQGTRTGLGALHLCVRVGDTWRWAGKVGSGLDDKQLAQLRKELDDRPDWRPTFPRPEGSGDARWIAPELVVQVRYREWLKDTGLRFPVFMRLRRDKSAEECLMPVRTTATALRRDDLDGDDDGASEASGGSSGDVVPARASSPDLSRARASSPDPWAPEDSDEREAPPLPPLEIDIPVRELRLSNPKKVIWPAEGEKGEIAAITKGELIAYYRAIAPWILPYLADRPTVLTRFPDGITGESFYQKDTPDWVPPWLRTAALWSEHSQREVHYLLIDDADGLAFIANLASIPVHVWASRIVDLQRPDWTIIDLDPKGAPLENVVPLARAIHELCESIGLPNYVKTSGQTGLHILLPLAGQCTYDQARSLALLLSRVVEQRHHAIATTSRNPAARGGKVYLDWGQNAHGQLLVAPFSARPVPGAPVSMPLTWDEVVPGVNIRARSFNLRNAVERMEKRGFDPVRPVLTDRPDLAAVLAKLDALVREV